MAGVYGFGDIVMSTSAMATRGSIGSSTESSNESSENGSRPQTPQTPTFPVKYSGTRPKYKLISEGDMQICRLNHTRTIVSKIMNSKYLRRWETHHIMLGNSGIYSASPVGFMECATSYSTIEDVHIVSRWDVGNHFCIRVTICDGSLLIQASNSYVRDQWLHSLQWKRNMYKYEKILKNARRTEVLIKEIKNLVDVSLNTQIHDSAIYQQPLDLVSQVLDRNGEILASNTYENIIVALSPIMEHNHPTLEICDFFSKHCKNNPRSTVVIELFTPVVQRILKHNMDFGKYQQMRTFIQDYIQALNCQNNGEIVVATFVRTMHGSASLCPHPRVLPNLVAVCLAAIYSCYEEKKELVNTRNNYVRANLMEWEEKVKCYISVLDVISEFKDWRATLANLLQPIPFPDDAITHDLFTVKMKSTVSKIASDGNCEVHSSVFGIREAKEGWFNLYCPGGIACDDDGELWGVMLTSLMKCCGKRKKFLMSLHKMLGPIMLLALRENEASMEVLCGMLEHDVIDGNDCKMQMVTTLQTTSIGKQLYVELCERQIALRELQQKGGPKKLTLPAKSTDSDLSKMLSSGSFGNLECLSLAFTQVTSACAYELIKLPALRYLNLWSTQFGDTGVQLISEHLHKLQVLNLCETPVTDKGLISLAVLKNLRKLNLNSTHLTALTFEGLKEKLPALQECDVRYTDAW